MISSVSLGNVRVFRGKESNFSFGDLGVLCGTNSSGKSSVLKSILLLRQSQGIDEPVRAHNGFLRFVGTQVDLGKFATYVSDRQIDAEITIGITVPHPIDKNETDLLRSAMPDLADPSEEQRLTCILEVRFTFNGISTRIQNSHSASTAGLGHNVIQHQGVLKDATFALKTSKETLLTWSVYKKADSKPDVPSYMINIPSKYFEQVGGYRIIDVNPSDDPQFAQISVVLDGILPVRLYAQLRKKNGDAKDGSTKSEKQFYNYPLPPGIDRAIKSLTKALTNVHYVGPLRAPAKRYYVTSHDSPPSMDPTGEFLPYLLSQEDEPQVICVLPKERSSKSLGLFAALDNWLYFIRTGETKQRQNNETHHEVRASSIKGVLVELEVTSPNNTAQHALADSGFGYSQLLPILVRGLMLTKNATLIIEQPEVHLNPGVQIRLAEFFVALALAGRQVLLETHSEHIVNAIRVLIAEQNDSKLKGRCNIFYIRASGDGPQVQPLSIDDNGLVSEWPYEFFGEAASLAGRLLRAQKKFRKIDQE